MEPAELGERWVQTQVDQSRPAFERGDDQLAFACFADDEASLRGQVAAFLAPVDDYLGKMVPEAHELEVNVCACTSTVAAGCLRVLT